MGVIVGGTSIPDGTVTLQKLNTNAKTALVVEESSVDATEYTVVGVNTTNVDRTFTPTDADTILLGFRVDYEAYRSAGSGTCYVNAKAYVNDATSTTSIVNTTVNENETSGSYTAKYVTGMCAGTYTAHASAPIVHGANSQAATIALRTTIVAQSATTIKVRNIKWTLYWCKLAENNTSSSRIT